MNYAFVCLPVGFAKERKRENEPAAFESVVFPAGKVRPVNASLT